MMKKNEEETLNITIEKFGDCDNESVELGDFDVTLGEDTVGEDEKLDKIDFNDLLKEN